jgi:hypothetical protein
VAARRVASGHHRSDELNLGRASYPVKSLAALGTLLESALLSAQSRGHIARLETAASCVAL